MKPIRSNHKDFLRSQSITRKRKKRKVVRMWISIVLIVILLTALAWITSLESLAIKKVIVVGNTNITSTEVQNIANEILDKKYLGIFSKRNAFIYPKGQITNTILEVYPRIEDMVVDTESLEILNIKIKERSAVAVWCAAVECYLVDDNGYIFAKSIENTENPVEPSENNSTSTVTVATAEPKIIMRGGDQLVGSEPIGKYIFTKKLYTDIRNTISELEEDKLKVSEVHVFSRDEIVFKLVGNGKLIFSDRKPFEVSLENLRSSLKSEVFVKAKQFEYIDVRFGNKVFYKLDKTKEELNLKASSTPKSDI